MLAAYGVEACRATIVREVSSVFGAYGIGVDPRHLSLIADFMTHLVRRRPGPASASLCTAPGRPCTWVHTGRVPGTAGAPARRCRLRARKAQSQRLL